MSAKRTASAASPSARLDQFLRTKDLSVLQEPLVLEKTDKYLDYLCFSNFFCAPILTCGMVCCFSPVATCCPGELYKHLRLTMHGEELTAHTAVNDICCHVAESSKTVPLERIIDVGLSEAWYLTCCGLKQVDVQTAAHGGSSLPEIAAGYLKEPEKVREAIRLAMQLQKANGGAARGDGSVAVTAMAASAVPGKAAAAGMAPVVQADMQRGGAAPAGAVSSLADRLKRLEALVSQGVISPDEAKALRVAVMAAANDGEVDAAMARMREARELCAAGAISKQEFGAVKASVMAQLTASSS